MIRTFVAAAGLLTLAAGPSLGALVEIDGKRFTVPDGFTVEKVAAAPLVDRPIVADFDERGRLYVADSSGSNDNVQKQLEERPHRIVRLEDADGDGRFDKQTIFADRMMFPEGAMWHAGSLYVAAPPSIWKLTDADDDGVADQRVEWFQGKTLTGCANDLHGPYFGPDGWIYWTKGAFAEQTYERPGRKPLVTRAAHIFRARPDGSGVEPVMTGGMDNPVEVAFTSGGERIFTTTFFQHPAGGQRDGLIHAVYGGVYGKVHDVIDNHPRTSAEVMPVLTHLGPAAPSGLMRYESTIFGREYQDNLFAALFNLHKVTRHVLRPSGATFTSEDHDFLVCDHLDFHPTDVLEDADGSLLVIDTGGWYKLCCPTSQLGKPDVLGALYRVRRLDGKPVRDPRGLAIDWGKASAGELAKLLGDERPAVRKRAIEASAMKGEEGVGALAQVLTDKATTTASQANAVWAAARINSPNARRIVRAALWLPDEPVTLAAIHVLSVCQDRESSQALQKHLNSPSPHVRRAAAEALGRVGGPGAVSSLLDALSRPADRVMEHSLIYALIEIADAKATMAGYVDARHPVVKRGALIALDQMESGGLTAEIVGRQLTASDPALRDAAAWVAGRHPEWGDPLAGVLGERLRSDLSAEERETLRHQLARLAKSEGIQRLLADRAGDERAPVMQRALSLEAMARSGLREPPGPWVTALSKIWSGTDVELIAAAVAAARGMPLKKEVAATFSPRLLEVASRADLPPAVRLDALAAIPGAVSPISAESFAFLLAQLGADQPLPQRLLAAEVVGRCKLNAAQLRALLPSIRAAGPLEIERLLAAFEATSDDTVGLELLQALREARAFRSVRPEAVRRRLAKYGDAVKGKAEEVLAALSPDADEQRNKLEQVIASLPPGDVRRGQLLFNSDKSACATCHAIGYLGGRVGPDLTRIGQVRVERDLLESILFPSVSFTQTYEPVMLDTVGGERHYGILRGDGREEVVLITGPVEETRIPRPDVKVMRPGNLSVMPDGYGEMLSKQELADLVAFLKACRG